MKKIRMICISIICLMCLGKQKAQAQADEIAQLVLNIEKLSQFRSILSDMKKGYEILNSGYNTIKNISEGDFNIHKEFLDGLMVVSPTVQNYRKVPLIIRNQVLIVSEYKVALSRFRQSDVFGASELQYMERVYANLLKQSLRSMDELLLVMTSNQLRMSDDERLSAIDRIFDEMEQKLFFLRGFNNHSSVLELQRTKEKISIEASRSRYGLDQK